METILVPSAGTPETGGTGSAVASATSSGSTTDLLSQEFPDCDLPAQGDAWRATIFALVNQARTQAGLDPVVSSAVLQSEAEDYACQMIHYGFFAHVNPVTGSTLTDRAAQFNYHYQVIGENLAAGQPTPEQVFSDWMNSQGHRANIMDPRFTELGVGVRTGGQYRAYWVQEFGLPLDFASVGAAR